VKWIGLTGGIATGKSTVAMILREMGHPVVDADELARTVVKPGTPVGDATLVRVAQVFGPEILNPDGSLDRSRLGQKVFQDPDLRLKLEAILHPEIQKLRASERRRLENDGFPMAFYDVPLLFEKHLESEFDHVVLVYTSEFLQRERLKARDHLGDEEISARLAAQWPIEEKKKRADYVILNSSGKDELRAQVKGYISMAISAI
jgi:dephospho-CoA kinase